VAREVSATKTIEALFLGYSNEDKGGGTLKKVLRVKRSVFHGPGKGSKKDKDLLDFYREPTT